MDNKYIGIENELITYNRGYVDSFSGYFPDLIKQFQTVHKRSSSAIRTDTGHGFYVDGSEIEILTPPVLINRGFATRLTDSLLIGRNKVIQANTDLVHTGYSTHWNISREKKLTTANQIQDGSNFFKGVAIPFHLFCLNPLSKGLNLRDKEDNGSGRYELLGDSINSEDQINASALMLGSYLMAYLKKPFSYNFAVNILGDNRFFNSFLSDGRYSPVKIENIRNGRIQVVQAQQLLESFYEWLKPVVDSLGTEQEISNLEAFILGKKCLDFDNFKYYAQIEEDKKIISGHFKPYITNAPKFPGTLLTTSEKTELPLENRLLGVIVSEKTTSITHFDWGFLRFIDDIGKGINIRGTQALYEYGRTLIEKAPVLESIKVNAPGKITEPLTKRILSYNSDEDTFPLQLESKPGITPAFDEEIKKQSIFSYLPNQLNARIGRTLFAVVGYAITGLLAGYLLGAKVGEVKNLKIIDSERAKIEQYSRVDTATNSVTSPALPSNPLSLTQMSKKQGDQK